MPTQPPSRTRCTRSPHPHHVALARYYDPTIGRFTAIDPLADLTQPGSIDAYGYGRGSPVTLKDPTGLIVDDCVRGNASCSNTGGEWTVTPKPPQAPKTVEEEIEERDQQWHPVEEPSDALPYNHQTTIFENVDAAGVLGPFSPEVRLVGDRLCADLDVDLCREVL